MTTVTTKLNATAASSSITINVMTLMDVGAILKTYPNLSQDPNSPTGISHNNIWMVSDDPRGWQFNSSDPGNITLNANVGDWLTFFCSSTDDNSDYAAFIYKIAGGTPVLNPSSVNVITRTGAAQPTAPNGYPFSHGTVSYSSSDAKVSQKGTAKNFWAYAALFKLADDGETQNLVGYVGWDPTVIVK
jgi:hypothetical protein